MEHFFLPRSLPGLLRFGVVKRCRDVRDLEKLGEILQFPQHQGDGEDRAELRLAGLFEAFDRAFRHADALGKFLLRDVLPDAQLAHPFGALVHHVPRDHQQRINVISHSIVLYSQILYL